MDCDSDAPLAHEDACQRVLGKFIEDAGDPALLPCEPCAHSFVDCRAYRGNNSACPNGKCVEPLLEEARNLLCTDLNVIEADEMLKRILCLVKPGTDPGIVQTATVLRSLSRVARPAFEQKPGRDPAILDSFSEVLDSIGFDVVGRDPLNFTAQLPVNEFGDCIPADTVWEGDIEQAIQSELLCEMDEALIDLADIPKEWQSFCEVDSFGLTARVDVDFSDVLLLRVHLHALRGLIHLLASHNLDVNLGHVCRMVNAGVASGIEDLLDEYPNLLTRSDDDAALKARDDFLASVLLFEEALDALLAETDDQRDDVIFLDPTDSDGLTPEEETLLRARLDAIQASLQQPAISAEIAGQVCGDPRVHAGAFFEGGDARDLLQQYLDHRLDFLSSPDPTFAGIFPGQTNEDLQCTLEPH
jgi:hypothetical protein